jgi:putative RecB family exonuclease
VSEPTVREPRGTASERLDLIRSDSAVDASGERVRALSPSRAGDFMNCPLLYRFRVIDRLPEAPSQAATRGTVVHTVLERLFDLPAPQRTLDAATELLGPAWQQALADDPELAALFASVDAAAEGRGAGVEDGVHDGIEQTPPAPEPADWLAGAEELLATYFGLEDPNRLEPAERELHLEVPLDSGLVLRGYVDRLDEAPNGALRVVDYKTGRAPRDGFEQKALFQMRFYALALWRLRGVIPKRLQLLYLGSGETVSLDPDEADLLAMERKLEALWTAIERAYATGDWRPNPSRLCDWCDHQALCPAWGGTPPPLPVDADPAVSVDAAVLDVDN